MARVPGTLTGTSFARGARTSAGLLVFGGQPAPDAVTGTTAYTLSASPATFTITGDAATLAAARRLAASPGTFTVTGDAATLIVGRVLSALAASYQITGSQAALALARILAANPGTFTVTGDAATLDYTPSTERTLDALAGTVLITGSSVTFIAPAVKGGSSAGRGEIIDIAPAILRNDDEIAALLAALL